MLSSLVAIPLALLSITGVSAQGDLSVANNVTDLEGTWSSNSAVSTGGNVVIPSEMTFNYPNNSGISYSFTNDGYFEELVYQYNSNSSNPACIQAYIYWQHGTYELNNNGSMTLYPFSSDGRIQVQDPCAATTNIITYYSNQVMFTDWGITVDPSNGRYVLQMNAFDQAKIARMYLIAKPPNMLPTQYITGTNATGQTNSRKRDLTAPVRDFFKRSAAEPRMVLGNGQILGMVGAVGTVVVGMMALF
ncbi:hypothetical protein L198_02100 [Cryptococcus wingfieldii CBS 7118]|uniref:Protein ROT1 n=1 Tax=Cryptococcus wingfieldii CBS 7118 TaxID=1295528 RepID=A0A1E3JYW9_9TREE|nr:hypothetical protein L198_02100 [Cryptococcus wingfieldii CBS 7118]ODO05407.1 hypothetical protein L198_02100 [Cryptococcus wingfieldii CBS 7118]